MRIEAIQSKISNFLNHEETPADTKKVMENSVRFLDDKLVNLKTSFSGKEYGDGKTEFSNKLVAFMNEEGRGDIDSTELLKETLLEELERVPHAMNGGLQWLEEKIDQAIAIEKDNTVEEQARTLALCLSDYSLDSAPRLPTLKEAADEKKRILYSFLADGHGASQESFNYIKNLINSDEVNEKGKPFIIPLTEEDIEEKKGAYFNQGTKQIVLSQEHFDALKSGSWNEEDLTLRNALMEVSHENFHAIVFEDRDKSVFTVFENTIRNKPGGDDMFLTFENRAKAILLKNGEMHYTGTETIMEEVYAMMAGVLQIPENEYDDLFSKESIAQRKADSPEEKLYGMKPILQELVADTISALSRDVIKNAIHDFMNSNLASKYEDTSQKQESTLDEGREEAKVGFAQDQNSLSSPEENIEEAEKVKVNRPLDQEKRQEFLKDFKEKKKYSESLSKQLSDAKSILPQKDKATMNKWLNFFSEEFNDAKNMLSHGVHTTAAADFVMDHIDKQIIEKQEKMVQQISSDNLDNPGLLKRAWGGVDFLSVNDGWSLLTQTWEYVKRRHETKKKRRVGRVGSDMASGISDGLSGEFDKEKENAEKTEVGEIQGALENKDDKDVLASLSTANNVDSFKATMQELAKRGAIVWEEKVNHRLDEGAASDKFTYAEKLKALGATVRFYPSDFLPKNQALMYSKYQKAFMQVYGESGMFQSIYNQNKQSIVSKSSEAKDVAFNRGGNPEQMLDWLRLARQGEYIPFTEYEGYIAAMVDDGTTSAINYVYYYIMGIEEGILQMDALPRFYGLFGNTFPPSNGMAGLTRDQVSKAAKAMLAGGENPWDGVPDRVAPWVHANIMTNKATVARCVINVGQASQSFDHDSADLLASVGDATNAVAFLAKDAGGKATGKETIYNQAILGMMQNVTSVGLNSGKGGVDKDTLQETIRRQAGYFSAFDSAGNGRISGAKSITRFSSSFLKDKPRAGDGYNGDMDTSEYLDMGREIFSQGVDPEFRNICNNLIFSKSLNGNPQKTVDLWNNTYRDSEEIRKIYHGVDPPLLEAKGDAESAYALIIDTIFTYYLGAQPPNSPNAMANVESIAAAAKSVAEGNGIRGNENSKKWSWSAIQ